MYDSLIFRLCSRGLLLLELVRLKLHERGLSQENSVNILPTKSARRIILVAEKLIMTEVIVLDDQSDHEIIRPSSMRLPLSPQIENHGHGEIALDTTPDEAEEQCMLECGCCFTESNLFEMVQCSDGHLFCFDCMKSYADEAIHGQGKSTLPCMATDCDAPFPRSQLERALTEETIQKFDERSQQEALNMANLPNLVRCPGCNYAAEIVEDNQQVFICPKCEKLTCRHCSADWNEHMGLTCSQVEKQDETKIRTKYEERMTKAKIRECPRCKAPVVKDGGCNRVTCRCGGVICYICRQPDIEYNHFCQHTGPHPEGCKECSLCRLWTNAEEDDKRAIQQLKLEGKSERATQGFIDDKDIGAPEEELPAVHRRFGNVPSKPKRRRGQYAEDRARRAVADARQALQPAEGDGMRPPHNYPPVPQVNAAGLGLYTGQNRIPQYMYLPPLHYPAFQPNDRFLPNKMVLRQPETMGRAPFDAVRTREDVWRVEPPIPATQPPPPIPATKAPPSIPLTQPPLHIPFTQAPLHIPLAHAPLHIPATQAPPPIPATQAPPPVPAAQAPAPIPPTHAPPPVPATHPPPPNTTADNQLQIPATQVPPPSTTTNNPSTLPPQAPVPAPDGPPPFFETYDPLPFSVTHHQPLFPVAPAPLPLTGAPSTATAATENPVNDRSGNLRDSEDQGEQTQQLPLATDKQDSASDQPGDHVNRAPAEPNYPDHVIMKLSQLFEEEQLRSRELEEEFNAKMEQLMQKTNADRLRLANYYERKRNRLKRPYET